MARTNKTLHVRTVAQKRRDGSRKYCKYRRHVWVYADWPLEAAPHRVLVAMEAADTSGVDPRELDEVEAFDWKAADIDWGEGETLELNQEARLAEYRALMNGLPMANWERELLGETPMSDPQDEEPEWYGDHMLVTDDPPVDGYGMFRGAAVIGDGYGFDAVFGEGYLGGNCGFSVKTRP